MIELFIKGGPIMWPLLLASIITTTVVINRTWFLIKLSRNRRDSDVNKTIQMLSNSTVNDAYHFAAHSEDPVTRILSKGLENSEFAFEESISLAAEEELTKFEQGIGVLDTAVTLAPLLGLLGTVTGMIRSFGILGAAELEAPVAITGGIAEALIATAFGLGIAIIAIVPLNILNSLKQKLRSEIENSATRLEIALKRQPAKPNVKQLRAL